MRILVIDDNDSVRRAMVVTLTREGHEVLEANGGAAALKLWEERGADVVLTDLRMGGMDGATVVRHLRALSPTLPVVVMSGDSGATAANLARDPSLKPIGILMKPFKREELLAAVAGAAAKRAPET